jgi:hypothetical protein
MTTSVTALFMTAIVRLVHENVYRPSHYHCLYNVFIELYGLICANTEMGPAFTVTTSLQAIKR